MEPRIMLNVLLFIVIHLMKCEGDLLRTHDRTLQQIIIQLRLKESPIPYLFAHKPILPHFDLREYNLRSLFHPHKNYHKNEKSEVEEPEIRYYEVVRHINCPINTPLCPRVVEKKPVCRNCHEDKNVAKPAEEVDELGILFANGQVDKENFDKNDDIDKQDFLDKIEETVFEKEIMDKKVLDKIEETVAEIAILDIKDEIENQDFLDKIEETATEKEILDKKDEIDKQEAERFVKTVTEKEILGKKEFLDQIKEAEAEKEVISETVIEKEILDKKDEIEKQEFLDKNEEAEAEKEEISKTVTEKEILDKNDKIEKQDFLDKNEQIVTEKEILDRIDEIEKQEFLDKNEEAEAEKEEISKTLTEKEILDKKDKIEKQDFLDKNQQIVTEKEILDRIDEIEKQEFLDKNEEAEAEKEEISKTVTEKEILDKKDKNEKQDFLDKNQQIVTEKEILDRIDEIEKQGISAVTEKEILDKKDKIEKQDFLDKNEEAETGKQDFLTKNEPVIETENLGKEVEKEAFLDQDKEAIDQNNLKTNEEIVDNVIKTLLELDPEEKDKLTLHNGPTEEDIINEESNTDMLVIKRQAREIDRLSKLIEQESLIPPSIIKGMAEKNLTDIMKRFLNQLDKTSLLEVIDSMKRDHLSKADPNDVDFINETFEKLRQSVTNMSGNGNNLTKRKSHQLNAGSVFELLAEQPNIDKRNENYDYYYSDMSYEESEETAEPSFLELITIADKHKANNFTS